MNKYDSYSADLSHIADRRRIGLWINKKDFEVFDSKNIPISVQVIQPLTDPFLIKKLDSDSKCLVNPIISFSSTIDKS